MKCAECGQVLPAGARFCTACGRRIAVEQPAPAIVRKPPPPDPRVRTEPALMRKPLSKTRASAAPAPDAAPRKAPAAPPPLRTAPWMHQLPMLMVGAGLMLGLAIYWSAQHDEAQAAKAGADRIAAATGPLATSQPVAQGRLDFSARQALQGLYGNYDPHLDGSYWTVRDAPGTWAEWNGKPVLVKPLVSRTDDSGMRHVLVTSTADVQNGMVVKQGTGCRGCKSMLGVALYERRGNQWQLVSHRPFASVGGAYGAPPQVAVAFPAKGGVELEVGQGATQLANAPEDRAIVITGGGNVVKTRAAPRTTRERRMAVRDDSPFPSSVSGP
ncbi:MAG TPA: zinc ribbon domain-containing protein [Burkholderiales bacterium]|nr:zinc ribbon domain-containing protein [Burkholderiales bacterium]